jgi:D-serine deaminase-like pyridoxal phosphate-dependent protein
MTWESHAIAIPDIDKKRRVINEALTRFTNTAQLCRDNGIPMEILSCGGTGTYWISATQEGISEIQAGGGIFCDIRYRNTFGVEHDYALTILSSVTSRASLDRIICDAGKKTMSTDAAVPEPIGIPNADGVSCSAEHGTIKLTEPSDSPRVGEQVEFVVGYSDTTVVLHNEIYGIRNGLVETVWPLWGRGKLQ